MGNGASDLAMARCSRNPDDRGEGPHVAVCQIVCQDASQPVLRQFDPAAGPNRSPSIGELCALLRDPNLLTEDGRPRHPSFAVRAGQGAFAETRGEALVMVRHTEEGLLSAKYRVQPLSGRCVFMQAALALAKANDGELLPPRAGSGPDATQRFCEERCARGVFGRVPRVTYPVEALLEQCRARGIF
mmetsp:Transcript_86009/g.238259  ORF Transcript_86009/g.238259 Transcript_86009/m.238259 type:complete len:187 (+) Transcript_86009:64-624(+)